MTLSRPALSDFEGFQPWRADRSRWLPVALDIAYGRSVRSLRKCSTRRRATFSRIEPAGARDGSSSRGDPNRAWVIRRTPIQGSCRRRFRIRRCRCSRTIRFAEKMNGNEMADPLDDFIDAVAKALALPVEEAWRPAVRANLEVSLRLARLVDEFALPHATEPASVYSA